MSSLKKQKKILEDNIKWEKDMVKNNKTYTGPNGKTYGANHYKKAIQYDQDELKKVKSNIKRNERISKLKEIASNVVKGAASAASEPVLEKTASKIRNTVGEKAREVAANPTVKATIKSAKEGAKAAGEGTAGIARDMLRKLKEKRATNYGRNKGIAEAAEKIGTGAIEGAATSYVLNNKKKKAGFR